MYVNRPVGSPIPALARGVVPIGDRDPGRIDHRAEITDGVIRRRVRAGPVAENGSLAIGVVGIRESRAVLVLSAD